MDEVSSVTNKKIQEFCWTNVNIDNNDNNNEQQLLLKTPFLLSWRMEMNKKEPPQPSQVKSAEEAEPKIAWKKSEAKRLLFIKIADFSLL